MSDMIGGFDPHMGAMSRTDAQDLADYKQAAEVLRDEVNRLREEVELWKDRWAAADQALTATIRDYENEIGR